jgi:hypothetical protein
MTLSYVDTARYGFVADGKITSVAEWVVEPDGKGTDVASSNDGASEDVRTTTTPERPNATSTRARKFPHVNRVDRSHCFSYTCAVVQRPSGLVVKGKSSTPEQRRKEWGWEERPKWGASPAKPCKPLRFSRCSSLLGVKRQRSTCEVPQGLATFSVHAPAEFCAGKFSVRIEP